MPPERHLLSTFESRHPAETFVLAARLGAAIDRGCLLALSGDLGSGKTLFTKGLACGLGVREHHRVNSPTFVIKQEYLGRRRIHHYDAYRLEGAEELSWLGFEEHLAGLEDVVVVEWAERVAELLPAETLEIAFTRAPGEGSPEVVPVPVEMGAGDPEPPALEVAPGESGRIVTFSGDPEIWEEIVRSLARP